MKKKITLLLLLGVSFCWGQASKVNIDSVMTVQNQKLTTIEKKIDSLLHPSTTVQTTKTICAYVLIKENLLLPLLSDTKIKSWESDNYKDTNDNQANFVPNFRYINMCKWRRKYICNRASNAKYFKHLLIDSVYLSTNEKAELVGVILFFKFNVTGQLSENDYNKQMICQNSPNVQLDSLSSADKTKGKLELNNDKEKYYIYLSDFLMYYKLENFAVKARNNIKLSAINPSVELIK